MSNYENNISGKLQQIYDIKNDIAEVIGTDSTDFSEYPELISEAISNGSGEGGGSVSQDGKYAFFHLTEDNPPTGNWTSLNYSDIYDSVNSTVLEQIDFYTGIYRTQEVMDPYTSELLYCNSYYDIEVRDSNNNLISMSCTSYDCSIRWAIKLTGTLSTDLSLTFNLTWNHGSVEPDENDQSMMIANWTQESLGPIFQTPFDVESGSQNIVIVVEQNTGDWQVEGEIVDAQLYQPVDGVYKLEWSMEDEE